MADQKLDLPPLRQAAPLLTVDEENRTAEVVFTTGALVPHPMPVDGEYRMVMTRIEVTEQAARLDRLNAGAPVLDSHSTWSSEDTVGVVDRAWIENGQGRAILRFSDADERANAIWQKVRTGVLRNVSMGFYVHAAVIEMIEQDGEMSEVWRLTDWEPFEISMVAVGADPGARVQRGAETVSARVIDSRGDMGMSDKSKAPAAEQPETKVAETVTQAATPERTVDVEAIRRQAAADERARVTAIRQTGTKLGLDEAFMQKAIEDGVSVDDFRAQAIEAFDVKSGVEAKQATDGAVTTGANVGGPRASVTADATDRFREGAALGIMQRAGLPGGERNEFTGMTLAEIARQSLAVAGRQANYQSRMEMVGQAFVQTAGHSTSDFANILANIMGKAALKGWEESTETWQAWTSTGTLTDFKPTRRVGTGVFSSLSEVPEGAEYTYGTMGDRGESITLATYGRLLKITRQAIINDDLSLLADAPRKMGRAARRTIGNLVYAVLTGNPTMSDGVALFDAAHNNLAASGGAPSVTTLAAARAAMRTQSEGDANALNITPAYFIVPAALETTAAQLMKSMVDPASNKGHAVNPVAGMAEVVVEPRLDADSTTAWYLAADPSMFDTVEVAFLDGIQEPYIEEKTSWSMDGAELKVRIDAGVAPLDYRTFYKNPGA